MNPLLQATLYLAALLILAKIAWHLRMIAGELRQANIERMVLTSAVAELTTVIEDANAPDSVLLDLKNLDESFPYFTPSKKGPQQ